MKEQDIYLKGKTWRINGVPYARFKTRLEAENYLKPIKPIYSFEINDIGGSPYEGQ